MTLKRTLNIIVSAALILAGLQAGTTDAGAQNKLLNNIKGKVTKTDGKKAETAPAQTKSWFDEPTAETPAVKKEEEVTVKASAEPLKTEKTEAEAKPAAEKAIKEVKTKTAKEAKANIPATDTTKVLLIGNSFTYCNDSWDMLYEIAKSEGHAMNIIHATKGGYSFADHLKDDQTTQAILKGDYDFAILQDQSQTPAKYALDPKGNYGYRNNFITMTNRIFGWSPYAKIVVEQTWAYIGDKFGGFQSMTEFDNYLENGARLYAEVIRGLVSPVGSAFAIARSERPDINLYADDNIHPSKEGTYLKSCVNYLTIFGGKFSAFATSCDIDPEVAKYLRTAAKKAVDSNK